MINIDTFKQYLVYDIKPPKSDIGLFDTKQIMNLIIHKVLYDSEECTDGIIDASWQIFNTNSNKLDHWGSNYSIKDYFYFEKIILRKIKLESL